MPGQYQLDVIGTPFSGVATKNGSMTVMACPQFGKRSTTEEPQSISVADVYAKYDDDFGSLTVHVTATATGTTDAIYASVDESVLEIRSSGTWTTESVTIEVSSTNEPDSFVTLQDSNGNVVFTAEGSVKVAGGMYYRMNVTTYVADVVMTIIGV